MTDLFEPCFRRYHYNLECICGSAANTHRCWIISELPQVENVVEPHSSLTFRKQLEKKSRQDWHQLQLPENHLYYFLPTYLMALKYVFMLAPTWFEHKPNGVYIAFYSEQ